MKKRRKKRLLINRIDLYSNILLPVLLVLVLLLMLPLQLILLPQSFSNDNALSYIMWFSFQTLNIIASNERKPDKNICYTFENISMMISCAIFCLSFAVRARMTAEKKNNNINSRNFSKVFLYVRKSKTRKELYVYWFLSNEKIAYIYIYISDEHNFPCGRDSALGHAAT